MLCGDYAKWIGNPWDYPLDEMKRIREQVYDLSVWHRGKYYLKEYVQERRLRKAHAANRKAPVDDITVFQQPK